MTFSKNKYLYLLYSFLTNLSPLSFIIVLFLTDNNFSLAEIGIIIAFYQASKLIFEIPSGYFADLIGRKLCSVIGQVLSIVFLLLILFFDEFIILLVASIFRGLSYSFLSGSVDSIFTESILIENPGNLEKWMSIDKTIFYISYGISAVIGGFLASFNYRYVFYFIIITQLICLALILLLKETNNHSSYNKIKLSDSFRLILNNKKIIYLLILPSTIAMVLIPYEDYYPMILNNLGVSELFIGIAISLNYIIASFISTKTQYLNNKLGEKVILIYFPYLVFLTFIILSIFQRQPLISWILYILTNSLAFILNISYNASLHKEIKNENRSTIISIRSFIMALTAISISSASGILFENIGFTKTFVLFSIIGLVLTSFLKIKLIDH